MLRETRAPRGRLAGEDGTEAERQPPAKQEGPVCAPPARATRGAAEGQEDGVALKLLQRDAPPCGSAKRTLTHSGS